MAEPGTYQPPERNPFERAAESFVASRPGAWLWVNVVPHLDRALMRVSRGRLAVGGRKRVGLLKVRGAKTGQLRHTPLQYARDGARLILIASRGGDVKNPAWYLNLRANPDVTFAIGSDERPYRARTLDGDERERAWRLACDRYAGYVAYQGRAGQRLIPVVALEPAEDRP
jgi:deazaflavin-dependent oxidoreductase (nitroreductase family)